MMLPSFSAPLSSKQAQPAEAGLGAKVPSVNMAILSASHFPPLLSWSGMAVAPSIPATLSASHTTRRGAFSAADSHPFEFDLQPVSSATFAGLVGGPAARVGTQQQQQLHADALAPADFLSMADAFALEVAIPTQDSALFGGLPLTNSAVYRGLEPTASFMALAAVGDDVPSDDDDIVSLSSSALYDLGNGEPNMLLTRDQARRAAGAEARRKRRAKVPVPDHKKDDKYWRRREKNNEAARRNRMMKKAVEGVSKDRLPELNSENTRLTDEVALLRSELRSLVGALRFQLAREGMAVDHPVFTR